MKYVKNQKYILCSNYYRYILSETKKSINNPIQSFLGEEKMIKNKQPKLNLN